MTPQLKEEKHKSRGVRVVTSSGPLLTMMMMRGGKSLPESVSGTHNFISTLKGMSVKLDGKLESF